jgi:tryptophan synthase alpha chain
VLEDYIKAKLEAQSLLLMTHAVVGYPTLDDNWEMLDAMHRAGIDLVELQLPFSEPIADGPAFIRANQSALEHGIHWKEYFDFFKKASDSFDFPLLFMGYYNSVFSMGHEVFCDRLKAAGGHGFIIADLPVEESSELDRLAASRELDHVQILTPVNSEIRLNQIAQKASGFLYCTARKGVTGKETDFNQELNDYLRRCRSVTDLPLAVGFGIKTAQQIRSLKGIADIAIIGTACLEVWEQQGPARYQEYLEELSEAAR